MCFMFISREGWFNCSFIAGNKLCLLVRVCVLLLESILSVFFIDLG